MFSELGEKLHEIRKKRVWDKTEGKCYYCGEVLVPNQNDGKVHAAWTMDHVIPRAKGGLDSIENMVPCCSACNQKKNNMDLEEYRFNLLMEVARGMWGEETTEMIYSILSKEVSNQLDLSMPRFYFEKGEV